MTPRTVLTLCCLVLTGAGMYFAPDSVATTFRTMIADALRPGHEAVRVGLASIRGHFPGVQADDAAFARLEDELESARELNRALSIRLAQINERKLTDKEISPAMLRTMSSNRLIVPSIVDVAVLGDTVAEAWRAGKYIDRGASHGLRENELVLSTRKSTRPLIDFGDDAEISVEDPLLLGRCVIGKIENVGKWTSTFQLVTDSKYRGRAQVIRETESGFVFEAQGILKGQGEPLCKLEGIPAGKSVRANDSVFTADRDGILPTPLYYGHVVEAILGPDDREWTISVKPASLPDQLTTVQVLRTAVNPERLAAQ